MATASSFEHDMLQYKIASQNTMSVVHTLASNIFARFNNAGSKMPLVRMLTSLIIVTSYANAAVCSDVKKD